jgi:uncharacterized protein
MQSILSKGNSIKEAINVGLEILDTTRDKVNIEIIEQGTKGILGIGSKKSVVKLTKVHKTTTTPQMADLISEMIEKDENTESLLSEDNLGNVKVDQLEGKVWISNGKIKFKSSPSQFPTISIQPGIRLYRNNLLVEEKTAVISDLDLYDIEGENVEFETKWKLTFEDQKLKTLLSIEPGYRIIRSIPDMEPSTHLEIASVEKKEVNNTLTYQDVMQKLEELGVKKGINESQIQKAIVSTVPSTFEVASGLSPKQGTDGWIELKVDVEMQKGPKERKDGRVDFRETMMIPNVERGQLIGIIHPHIPGEPGFTVTDETILPKQVYPTIFIAGTGVVKVAEKIVATQAGRPFIERRGKLLRVKIFQKLTHKGNIDLSSGNIRFSGDVEIFGEVKNNMVVEAEGDIYVQKTVTNATLTSSGAIQSNGSIIGSEVSAGKNNILVTELGQLLGIIYYHVQTVVTIIKQLNQTSAFKSSDFQRGGLQPLIRILLEKKFKSFPPVVKKYIDAVRRGEKYLEDEDWRLIGATLSRYFLSISNEATSLDDLILLTKKMKKLIELADTPVEPDSYITIPNALNSKLYCSGNVHVFGQGCVNTKIHSGGMLKISGIIRGGEVYGRMGVEVNESGAESASLTLISVPSDQKIQINKAMEGTVIKIGSAKFIFKETRYNIHASLDHEGRIVFK